MSQHPISIFLDSNIFIGKKYDFTSSSIFNTLANFTKTGEVKIYISHIVESEVKKHIEANVNTMLDQIEKAKNEFTKKLSINLINECGNLAILDRLVSENLVRDYMLYFDNFIKENNVTILNSNNIDCNKIINDYFNSVAPFESNSKKKSEFPDAFMAAKLKEVFTEQEPVHIISQDKGFLSSFECNKNFHTHTSLEQFLDLINKTHKNGLYRQISTKLSHFNTDLLCMKMNTDMNINNFLNVTPLKEYFDDLDCIAAHIHKIQSLDIKSFLINEILSNSSVYVSFKCTAEFLLSSDYINLVADNAGEFHVIDEVTMLDLHKTTFDCSVKLNYQESIDEFEILNYPSNIKLNNSTFITTKSIVKQSDRFTEEDCLGDMYDTLDEYHNY